MKTNWYCLRCGEFELESLTDEEIPEFMVCPICGEFIVWKGFDVCEAVILKEMMQVKQYNDVCMES